MDKNKSLVVLSGGQDSVTTLYDAARHSEVVGAVHFQYGQRHAVEARWATFHAQRLSIPLVFLDLPTLSQIGHSALVDGHSDLGAAHPTLAHLPASFVPGRNLVFLTLAAALAMKLGATEIWTGVCQTDYSGYPDCREETIRVLEVGLRLGMDFPNLRIVTPLMNLSKAETFALAMELGVLELVLNCTHTCYEGDADTKHDWGFGCGRCPACEVRANGWDEFIHLKDQSV